MEWCDQVRLAKAFLYNLFPYKHITAGLNKLNPSRSHYNVLAAGPGGTSMPLHICASTRNGDSEAEIIERAGFNVRASFERVTISWEKSSLLLGYNQYSLYVAEEQKGGGGFYPDKYELYISNLKPGTDYRLVLSDSSGKKPPISISFRTYGSKPARDEAPVEVIKKSESEIRIMKANEAIRRVLKERYVLKRNKVVKAALAALEIDGLTQEEARALISALLNDFYPSQPRKRRAIIEQIKQSSTNFNLDGLE